MRPLRSAWSDRARSVVVLLGVIGAIGAGAASGVGTTVGAGGAGAVTDSPRLLDDFRDPALWVAKPSSGVELSLAGDRGEQGRHALRLDFDFRGRGGWAAASRPLAVELPENWELRFRLRGDAPVNDLEVKLVDPSGENVWWMVRRDYAVPHEWTTLKVRKRQLSFAWGPAGGTALARTGALEVVVTAGAGGRGALWLADLELVPLPPEHPYAGVPRAVANRALSGHPAEAALDATSATAWRAASAPAPAPADIAIDFGEPRELGALSLLWEPGRVPTAFAVDASDDGADWREIHRVTHGGALRSELLLPETESRWLRLRVLAAPTEVGLAGVDVRPVEAGASPNAFFAAVAGAAPRGSYPRGLTGEQVYWTVVGADADADEALVSEDGAVEIGERGFTLEPFVSLDGRLWTWADVVAERSLLDRDLPIPTVAWPLPGLRLEATVLATGRSGDSSLLVRYHLRNTGDRRRAGELWLAVRPFQVNPPTQQLSVPGGVAPLATLACDAAGLAIEGRPRLALAPAPERCGVQAFDEGGLVERLAAGELPSQKTVHDDFPYASGALGWGFDLAPGEASAVIATVAFAAGGAGDAGTAVTSATALPADAFESRLADERLRWRAALDRVTFELPGPAGALAELARASLAWVLVHRDGPALQPGSRSYARSWIRDGALSGEALLRMGRGDVARDFADWYATFQAPGGGIPCCVDRHGASPVPEHDSHGEFLHLVREIQRTTGDAAFAARMLPHVDAAVGAIAGLLAGERTAALRSPDEPELIGILPASISHEGYAAKPMHSYWDDAFAYRGLSDASAFAADLAPDLGAGELAARAAALADRLRTDLLASIARTREKHGIAYLPGCAELGDFDATSSTVLLEPGGLGGALPPAAVEATFERYWHEVETRSSGESAWQFYTPYELRSVGAFVRLGWRERAQELLGRLLAGRRPPEWNQWPEVVSRDLRAPYFLGDLPHGWVATDFVRSFLDLFAYEEREREALVLAAGIPADWLLGGEAVGVRGLVTPWGSLDLRLRLVAERLVLELAGPERWPPGGVQLVPPLVAPSARAWIDGIETRRSADGALRLARPAARIEFEVTK